MHDIVIIGSGPAGLTAALYALRAGKSVVILEKSTFGGQVTFSPKIENFPGNQTMSGNEFADRFVGQVLSHGADIELEEAVGIEDKGNIKTVHTASGTDYDGKAVIIACGVRHRRTGAENEEKFLGEGISFCAVCDGDFYKGRRVAVIGGGNSALQEASMLSEKCESVTLVQNLPVFTGEEKLLSYLKSKSNVSFITSSVVKRFTGEEKLTGIDIENTDGKGFHLSVDGVFVAIGLIPSNGAFSPLAQLDGNGYFDSGEECLTSTPGVFVAGDCRRKAVRQITTAAADGSVASLTACRYIG